MQDATELGRNRTGIQMSPLQDELAVPPVDDAAARTATSQPANMLLAEVRREYIDEAEAFGSIPPPGTAKGMLKSGAGMLTGRRIHVLVDKIAERLAFERGGTRLYDAVLVKALALAEGTPVSVERLQEIRDQEAAHAALLVEALRRLGADPTAQTPCADLVGVQTLGLLQSVTDPRSTLTQTLSSALAAELIDVASWDMLARLARSLGQEELATRFEAALAQENHHLETISAWQEALVMNESKLLS